MEENNIGYQEQDGADQEHLPRSDSESGEAGRLPHEITCNLIITTKDEIDWTTWKVRR